MGSSRFPGKPLAKINGKPMIQTVVENLNIDAKHIFIVQKEHYEKYNLKHYAATVSDPIVANCAACVISAVAPPTAKLPPNPVF